MLALPSWVVGLALGLAPAGGAWGRRVAARLVGPSRADTLRRKPVLFVPRPSLAGRLERRWIIYSSTLIDSGEFRVYSFEF